MLQATPQNSGLSEGEKGGLDMPSLVDFLRAIRDGAGGHAWPARWIHLAFGCWNAAEGKLEH